MTITLSADQLAWVEARVARGEYGDIDEAVRNLLAGAIAERGEVEDDDIAWAKPLVDEALVDIERGNFTVIDDTDAYIDSLFRAADG